MNKYCGDKFKNYFKTLGYGVSWDFKASTQESWWEIIKDGKMLCQIDIGVPIEDAVEDLICWANGKEGTSKSDYKVNAPESVEFDELLQKVKENPLAAE